MGSGRSGAGGGGGGGGVTLALPKYSFNLGKPRKADKDEITQEVNRVVKNLSIDYLKILFGSAMTRSVYEQLFNLSVHIFQNKSWNGIEEIYGVSGEAGCLHKWATAILQRYEADEPNEKIRGIIRSALEDFLIQALNNNEDVYDSGTSDKVMQTLRQKTFTSTSAYFLRGLIWRMLERQDEPLRADVEVKLKDISLDKADAIIRWFDRNFHHKSHGQKLITHQDLFLIVQENMSTFIKELKK